jgi:hypothetical protein
VEVRITILLESVFGEPTNGPFPQRFGANFISASQDSTANCTGYVGLILAQSCSLVDSATVILTMADVDSSFARSFSLTIQAGEISVFSSLPVR